MTFLLADRVQVTATANTTVSFTLSGAMTSYQSFAAIGNGNTTYYGATDGTNWETGIGTYSTTGPTLTRTTILSSSNSGSAVTFSGTVTVWVDYPSEKAVIVNDLGDVLVNQSTDQGTGVLQVTGQSTFNGVVTDKSLNLQGGNNLVTYSQDFTNAAWVVTNTVVSGTYLAPDGTTTAQLIADNSTNGLHRISQTYVGNGNQYAFSLYAAPNTSNFIGLFNSNTSQGAFFNVSTGVFTGNIIGAPTSYHITKASNGFYRIDIQSSPAASGTGWQILMSSDGTAYSYAGTGKSVYIWGAQLELGTVASAYTPTTTTAITTTNNISVPSGSVSIGNYLQIGTNLAGGSIYAGAGFATIQFGNVLYGNNGLLAIRDGGVVVTRGVGIFGWENGANNPATGTIDLYLSRDAANTLAQRNSTNAQTFRLYNTYTSTSLGEWLSVDWTTTANTATIATKANGAGVVRTLATGNPLVISTGYTVATLPTGVVGMRAYVTNALAPAYGVAVTGGGAVTIPVFYNGTAWICA